MKNPYNKEQRGCRQLLKRTALGCVVVLLVLGCVPTRVAVQDSRLPPPEFFEGDCPAGERFDDCVRHTTNMLREFMEEHCAADETFEDCSHRESQENWGTFFTGVCDEGEEPPCVGEIAEDEQVDLCPPEYAQPCPIAAHGLCCMEPDEEAL